MFLSFSFPFSLLIVVIVGGSYVWMATDLIRKIPDWILGHRGLSVPLSLFFQAILHKELDHKLDELSYVVKHPKAFEVSFLLSLVVLVVTFSRLSRAPNSAGVSRVLVSVLIFRNYQRNLLNYQWEDIFMFLIPIGIWFSKWMSTPPPQQQERD